TSTIPRSTAALRSNARPAQRKRSIKFFIIRPMKPQVLPPAMVSYLCEGEINDKYVGHMIALNRKLAFSKKAIAKKDIGCVEEVRPEIQKLAIKVCTRVSVAV
ncbi:hypothetical protein SARC_16120, partial [Sphaeroforma arctica JP610]